MNSSFQCAPFAAVLVCFVAASTAQVQGGTQFKDWNPPFDEVRLKAKLACADLLSLTGLKFSVVTANMIHLSCNLNLAPGDLLPSGPARRCPEIRKESR